MPPFTMLRIQEPSVKSVVWNSRFDDLLCFAGSGFVAIKMANIPMQTIEFSDQVRFCYCDKWCYLMNTLLLFYSRQM